MSRTYIAFAPDVFEDELRRFAARVRQLREERGLSREQAAELAAVSEKTWQNAETPSDQGPTLRTLLAVSRALGVSLDHLVG